MALSVEEQQKLRDGVDKGNIPTLLMVLVQLTGDLKWLEAPYKPTKAKGMDDNSTGGLSAEVQSEIRDAAFEAILGWKNGTEVAIPEIPPDLIVRMLGVSMGDDIPAEYAEFTAAQLGQTPLMDPRPISVPEGFKVLVVGAGVSGLCCAVYLQQAGIPYVVLEKAPSVGGVWWQNRYPGCGVDSPNHLYCYSFAPNDWAAYFAPQGELWAYFDRVSREFDIRKNIRFETELSKIVYDEKSQMWCAAIQDKDGRCEQENFNVVLSGVGLFNPPVLPQIAGLDQWTAQKWHSANWPDDAEISDKRVGIIGTGATSMQIGPAIKDQVKSLTIFQRDPHWVGEHIYFQKQVDGDVRYLFQEVPLYRDWYRARLGWSWNDRAHITMFKDPDWQHKDRSINSHNERARVTFTNYLTEQLGDHFDEYKDKVLPTYPPFGKRMLLDNGWYRMLTESHVQLVNDPIVHCEGNKVITQSGEEVELDVLVLATGFGGQKMVDTYDVTGRGGRTLRDEWGDDDPKAYLGTMVSGFPNFFVLYGPNLQPGHGGSLTFSVEMQVRYVMDIIRGMAEQDLGAVEISESEYQKYNDSVDAMHEKMLWTHPKISTYYRNKAGRVVINSPWRNVDFYHMTEKAEMDRYEVEPRAGSSH